MALAAVVTGYMTVRWRVALAAIPLVVGAIMQWPEVWPNPTASPPPGVAPGLSLTAQLYLASLFGAAVFAGAGVLVGRMLRRGLNNQG